MSLLATQLLATFLVGFVVGMAFLYCIAVLTTLDARRRKDGEPPQKGFGL